MRDLSEEQWQKNREMDVESLAKVLFHNLKKNPKSLFEKSFWVKLFALKPSFFFKTRFLPQSRRASTIQRHIITIFSKPCQVNRRGLVSKPDGLGDPTPTLRCGSLWIDKSTAPWDHPLLFKTGSHILWGK